ncbi:MAG: hypothetical protein ACE5D0_02010 [Fidelibacterota bacterium]
MKKMNHVLPILFYFFLWNSCRPTQHIHPSNATHWTQVTVVIEDETLPLVEQTAVTVLVEEVEKRTGIRWKISNDHPTKGKAILIQAGPDFFQDSTEQNGRFAISTDHNILIIQGIDPKGVMNGVGKLLRTLQMSPGEIVLDHPLNIQSSPDHRIRGHQLGYRPTANSYDAWTPEQYDQYIRELAIFGVNAIENIPLSGGESPLMPLPKKEMNRVLGNICRKYGMQYWVWTPATVDLSDPDKRAAHLLENEAFYEECTKLDAVFFPGGDPGNNHPKYVMPFLEDISELLKQHFPHTKIWMSLQGFEEDEILYFFQWIQEYQPSWFGGAVGGPSSPPLPYLREQLPKQYLLRDYPDITHTVRAQYPAVWIDPAFAFTSGREGTNPEPVYYSTIFHHNEQYIDGFITYSDGIHDDVNKFVYSLLGWDHQMDVRDVIREYSQFFFSPALSPKITQLIFSLESNWSGPLVENTGVNVTLEEIQSLEQSNPELNDTWRWQFIQLKGYYDAYIRARLLHEQGLENEVNVLLGKAPEIGAGQTIEQARAIFARVDDHPIHPEFRQKIIALCGTLYENMGYQSSVPKYGASNPERSAVLDYIDYPLNNRWWIEDQFAEIEKMTSEDEKLSRLDIIRTWEHPGPGSFYDDIGNISKSEHVLRGKPFSEDPLMITNPNPDFMWWNNGMARVRQSWVSKMDWPVGLQYDHIDPTATYILRTTGYGQCLVSVNGKHIFPTLDGKGIGEIKEFPISKDLYRTGTIKLTFEIPYEPDINWRLQSRLNEVWLIKR